MNEILEAKRRLYYLLMTKPTDELTGSEIDVAYYLAKDKDIQSIFDKAREEYINRSEDQT